MSSPRITVLSVLDGRGRFGLGPDVQAALGYGVEVVPIATGVVQSESDDQAIGIRPVRPRLVAAALEEALAEPMHGMLVGLLPDYWQARAVVRTLGSAIPETLVYAPLNTALAGLPFLGSYNRRLQLGTLLPEATVTVLPADGAGELLGRPELDADGAAEAIVAAGCHAAWIRERRMDGRCVDVVRWGSDRAVLDTPPPTAGARPHTAPAALAALLAMGRDLDEATEMASRSSLGHWTPVQAPASA